MPDLGNRTIFFQTDGSNGAGSNPGFPEGMPASRFNDAARALQGALTRDWDYSHFTLTSSGSANAYLLTYTVAPEALQRGLAFAFTTNFAVTGAATLNVNVLGAIAIKKDVAGVLTDLVSGDMASGQYVRVEYNGTVFVWTNWQGPIAATFTGGALTTTTSMTAKAFNEAKGAAVASAATTDIWTPSDGNEIPISGAGGPITSLGTAPQAGAKRTLIVASAGVIFVNNGTTMQVQGGTYTSKAGDRIEVLADTTANMIVTVLPAYSAGVLSVRHTVAFGPQSSGAPSFLPATSASLNLTAQNITSALPLVITAAQGMPASDVTLAISTNTTWTGLTASSTLYLYVNAATGATGFTSLVPIYQYGGAASITSGQFTFNIGEMTGYMGNGAAAAATPLVFVGEAVTAAGTVTSTIAYAYNGFYDSGFTATLVSGSLLTKNANLGLQTNNASFVAECTITDLGYAVGTQMVFSHSQQANAIGSTITTTRNTVSFIQGTGYFVLSTTAGNTSLTLANWKYKLIARRGW